MKKIIIAFIALFMVQGAVFAAVNTAVCAGCHGPHFEKSAMGKSKIVKNMSREDVSKALVGYKNGTYGGTMKNLMKMQVSKYSVEELQNTGVGKQSFTDKVKSVSKAALAKTKAIAKKTKTKVTKYFSDVDKSVKIIVTHKNIIGYNQGKTCWVVDYKNKKSNLVDCDKLKSASKLEKKSMLPPTTGNIPNPLSGMIK
jgi:cytochrome c-type protein NapB